MRLKTVSRWSIHGFCLINYNPLKVIFTQLDVNYHCQSANQLIIQIPRFPKVTSSITVESSGIALFGFRIVFYLRFTIYYQTFYYGHNYHHQLYSSEEDNVYDNTANIRFQARKIYFIPLSL